MSMKCIKMNTTKTQLYEKEGSTDIGAHVFEWTGNQMWLDGETH